MRIVVVSQYYPPEAVPIPADLARELSERGHAVRVLTGFPNYPSGQIFSGYRQRWRTRETDGQLTMMRVPLLPDHSQNPIKRMLNYLSFALSSSTARRYSRGADVVYVYATQMTAALGPWLWRITGGAPYVLHVQDLWPDSILGSSMIRGSKAARVVERVLSAWIGSVYRHASAVVGIAPTMVETLIQRGVPATAASLVYNWADAAGGSSSPAEPAPKPPGVTTFVYAGNLGEMQDLETVIRAAHASADAGVRLLVVGDGVVRPRLKELVAELGASNIVFEEPVPREQVPEVYARADFGLVCLKDLPVFRGTIPSKFQAVLAHGLPVVSTVQGDVRRIVEELNVGLTADSEDDASLESTFRRAAAMSDVEKTELRNRTRTVYLDHFDRSTGMSRIETILLSASQSTEEKP